MTAEKVLLAKIYLALSRKLIVKTRRSLMSNPESERIA